MKRSEFAGVLLALLLLVCSCSNEKPDGLQFRKLTSEHEKESLPGQKEQVSVSSADAAEFAGDSLTVTGFVADVFENDKVTYLNFDRKFPRSTFTCAIFSGSREKFGNIPAYKGRKVQVTGKITMYRKKPQMILWNESQIKIIE